MGAYRDTKGKLVRVFQHELRKTAEHPRLVLRFAEVDGRAECVSIEIGPDFTNPSEPDPAPLSTSTMRSIRFGELIASARRDYARDLSLIVRSESYIGGEPADPRIRRRARRRLPAVRDDLVSRKGRPAVWDLDEVARIYSRAFHGDVGPTRAVQGKLGISYAAARTLVSRARRQGLLPATVQGRAKGIPATRRRRKR